MEEITITKLTTYTIITITNNGTVLRKIADTINRIFKYNASTDKIEFPGSRELNELFLSTDKLSSATSTALGNPADNIALFDALVSGAFFEGK